MPPSSEEARRLLCALGDHVRHLVMGARGMDMAAVAGESVADTIYAIDRVADDALIDWFEQHWPDVVVVSEGLDEPVLVGNDAAWTVIVDTIDGTRGLMYDKRPAWCLAAVAPLGGGLADIVAAAMTELPTAKQGAADQLSATRRGGLRAGRVDLASGAQHDLDVRPSAATDLDNSFSGLAKFFLPGKPALAALEAESIDGGFISIGPGDPTHCHETVYNLGRLMETSPVPVMGICLGQLFRYVVRPAAILVGQRRWPGLGELYRSNPLEIQAFEAMDRDDPLPRHWGAKPR